jgi:hypothetical protein
MNVQSLAALLSGNIKIFVSLFLRSLFTAFLLDLSASGCRRLADATLVVEGYRPASVIVTQASQLSTRPADGADHERGAATRCGQRGDRRW